MLRVFSILMAVFFVWGVPSYALDWQTDVKKSEIVFSGSYANAPFKGHFKTWTASIQLDPENLSAAKVYVEIDTGSADMDNALHAATLKSEDWFDVKNYPQAVFEASKITRVHAGLYRAEGHLAIKGKSLPLAFDFQLDIAGDAAKVNAQFDLDRVAYALGVRSDPTADWVSRTIRLDIALEATKTP